MCPPAPKLFLWLYCNSVLHSVPVWPHSRSSWFRRETSLISSMWGTSFDAVTRIILLPVRGENKLLNDSFYYHFVIIGYILFHQLQYFWSLLVIPTSTYWEIGSRWKNIGFILYVDVKYNSNKPRNLCGMWHTSLGSTCYLHPLILSRLELRGCIKLSLCSRSAWDFFNCQPQPFKSHKAHSICTRH